MHSDSTISRFRIVIDAVLNWSWRQIPCIANSKYVKLLFSPTNICLLLTILFIMNFKWRLVMQTASPPPATSLKLSFSMSTSSKSKQCSKSLNPWGICVISTSLWNSVIGSPYRVPAKQFVEVDVRRIQNSSRS